jgi:hypothetical protein
MHFITNIFLLLFCMYNCSVDATPNYADKIAMTAKEMYIRADIQRQGSILAWIVICLFMAQTQLQTSSY